MSDRYALCAYVYLLRDGDFKRQAASCILNTPSSKTNYPKWYMGIGKYARGGLRCYADAVYNDAMGWV